MIGAVSCVYPRSFNYLQSESAEVFTSWTWRALTRHCTTTTSPALPEEWSWGPRLAHEQRDKRLSDICINRQATPLRDKLSSEPHFELVCLVCLHRHFLEPDGKLHFCEESPKTRSKRPGIECLPSLRTTQSHRWSDQLPQGASGRRAVLSRVGDAARGDRFISKPYRAANSIRWQATTSTLLRRPLDLLYLRVSVYHSDLR